MGRWTKTMTALSLGCALYASDAAAQEDEEENVSLEEEGGEGQAAEGEGAEEGAGEKKEGEAEATKEAGAEPEADAGPKKTVEEEPGKTYRFVGLRYRGIIVPQFMVGLFADGGTTVYVHGIGPEFAIRKDNVEYNLSAWLGFYSMDNTPFKGKDDGEDAWEHIKSELKVLYLTADFLFSEPMSPEFAFNYGVGAGFGIVFGSLYRSQVYPGPGDSLDDPGSWDQCAAFGSPPGQYCVNDNDFFQEKNESSWVNGGSKPNLFPWLALQFGLRYKPAAEFVGRLDLGFGTSGFFFGIGADYGL